MDLFLVRHGETEENATGIVQGWLDTNLNENGKVQARAAAEHFSEAIDAIYCSDLKRALQTAAEFRKKYPDTPYFEDERLRERNFGDASGDHRDKYDWEVFWASSGDVYIPNAETLTDYNARVTSFLESLKSSGFQKVLVVSHGGTINRVQHLTNPDHQHIAHANAGVTKITL